jgi:predicted metal-dependent hydrolase
MMRRLSKAPSTRAELRATIKLLRLLASPSDGRAVRVRVVRSLPKDRLGDCAQGKGGYTIRLSAEVVDNQPDALWMLLAHEWAHALAWENCTHNHGEAWGMALAKAWRIISGELATGDLNDMD